MSSTPAKKRAVETAGPSLGSLSFAAVLDSPPLGQRKYGFLGAGVMASAMIAGILRAGTTLPENVMASDPSDACLEKQKSLGVRVSRSNREVAEFADVLFIAVKVRCVAHLE